MPTGPSSSRSPYLVSANPFATFASIITTGDTAPGAPTPFVGKPDGIGAFDNGDGTATIVVNHELPAAAGAVRGHGSAGSFVDRLVVNIATLQVVSERDAVTAAANVFTDPDGDGIWTAGTTAFDRLCSGDLAAVNAYFNPASGLGTVDRIYLNGEEASAPPSYGRAFAWVLTGTDANKVFELPKMGELAYENLLVNAFTGDKTVVMMQDDTGSGTAAPDSKGDTGGEVYMYVGTKQSTGNAVQKAGLTNGTLFGVHVNGIASNDETPATSFAGDVSTFTMVALPDQSNRTGVQLEADSEAAGITEFLRPEDGAWDPSHPNWYYFTTTASFSGPSRLWRLEFTDINNPSSGGIIRMLLTGNEGQKMLDNLAVAQDGKVVLLEDVGSTPFLGRVLLYDPAADTLAPIGIHDASRFVPGGANFLTQDEEASGVIDVTSIFGNPNRQAFLLDTQAHHGLPSPLVEGGQLQIMYVDKSRSADFDASGVSDILWRGSSGQVAEWQLNTSAQIAGNASPGVVDAQWRFLDSGDFNSDSRADVLWRNADNDHPQGDSQVVLWTMNGSQIVGNQVVGIVSSSWHELGVGDFDGDTRADVLWRSDSGQTVLWKMNGAQIVANQSVANIGSEWHPQGVADFTGDGRTDVLWRSDSGQVVLWSMNGAQIASNQAVANLGLDWNIYGTGDFDNDGRGDVLLRHDSGQVVLWKMNGAQIVANTAIATVGNDWHVEKVGDYNGDGNSDVFWRNDSGQVVVWEMNGAQIMANHEVFAGGQAAKIGLDWTALAHHYDVL